jgi:hypothetical protein
MDEAQKPSKPKCYTPSSELLESIYLTTLSDHILLCLMVETFPKTNMERRGSVLIRGPLPAFLQKDERKQSIFFCGLLNKFFQCQNCIGSDGTTVNEW